MARRLPGSVQLTGAGISRQAFALSPKLLEVDAWMSRAPCPVYEVHPELSFALLLGAPAAAPKKSWAGMAERRRALDGAGLNLDDVGGEAATRAGVDDMLDAESRRGARSASSAARSHVPGGRSHKTRRQTHRHLGLTDSK